MASELGRDGTSRPVVIFSIENSQVVGVESALQASAYGDRPVARGERITIEAAKTLEEALGTVKPVIEKLAEQFRKSVHAPNQVEIEFGVRLDLQLGAIIAASTMEGHFNVKCTWSTGADA